MTFKDICTNTCLNHHLPALFLPRLPLLAFPSTLNTCLNKITFRLFAKRLQPLNIIDVYERLITADLTAALFIKTNPQLYSILFELFYKKFYYFSKEIFVKSNESMILLFAMTLEMFRKVKSWQQ